MGSETTTELKVGDKVKIITEVFWIDKYFTNKIGVIKKANIKDRAFPYIVCIDAEEIPVDRCEIEKVIEKVIVKGQQLLFSFME